MRTLQITFSIVMLMFACGGPATTSSSSQNPSTEIALPSDVSESINEVVAQTDSLENDVTKMEEEIDELLKDIK